eukprot:TRINITY_DN1657_c0_g1_i1.p1 TRINITY_DN1657_c0_g1~~TRINITY_DN1657_c0_g1_i1.p1  ORF type:complete len:991 (-),score=223.69 TRINITY_DN1657_c0_g1_i1:7-2979(-)
MEWLTKILVENGETADVPSISFSSAPPPPEPERRKKRKHDKEKPHKSKRRLHELGTDAECYYAPRGDSDNLVYGKLYSGSIPPYLRANTLTIGVPDVPFRSKPPLSGRVGRYWNTALARDPTPRDNQESSAPVETPEQLVLQRAKEFAQRTRSSPHHLETWLEYVAFQDEYLPFVKSDSAVTEKKISILQKALAENPGSVTLLTTMLNLGKQLWDADKLLNMWQQTVAAHPHSVALWTSYIAFRQSHFTSFSVLELRALFGTALRTMSAMDAPPSTRERAELDVFVGACVLEKQAGYIERAIANYQALVEFNCFCPESLTDHTLKLKWFGEFWESDVPRVGETGATGWEEWLQKTGRITTTVAKPTKAGGSGGHWVELSSNSSAAAAQAQPSHTTAATAATTLDHGQDTVTATVDPAAPFEDRLEQWLDSEAAQQTKRSLPRRVGEVTADPDCVVLWDDIQSYMFTITTPAVRLELIVRFLHFLGVAMSLRYASSDPYIRTMMNNAEDVGEMIAACGSAPRDLEVLCQAVVSMARNPLPNMRTQQQGELMEDETEQEETDSKMALFARMFAQEAVAPLTLSKTLHSFVSNLLSASYKLFPQCVEIRLAFLQFAEQVEGGVVHARALAKTLLKAHSSDLRLWAAFAEMERRANNFEEARRVYDTALSMLAQLPSTARADAPLLYRAYAEMELTMAGQVTTQVLARVQHILCLAVEGTEFKPLRQQTVVAAPAGTRVVKARRSYAQLLRECASGQSGQKDFATLNMIVCYLLFEYVTSGVDASVSVMRDVVRSGSDTAVMLAPHLQEQLHQSFVVLLLRHCASNASPPAILRSAVENAVQSFPSNPFFLAALVAVEARSKVSGRVRRFFDSTTQRVASPLVYAFAVRAEVDRAGTEHRVRSILERCMKPASGVSCVALWRLFLLFEVCFGRAKLAERVFFRAVQQCPQSKRLWLDSLRLLRGTMPASQLTELLNVLSQKDLRVISDVDELGQ